MVTTLATGLDHAPSWADAGELDRFEAVVARFAAGDLDAEAFRRLRIWHGVYSQRQGADAYMLRVKVPGGALSADALDALADVAERYSRGWGHITTRQNVELHFVALADVVPALRRLAAGGLTSRESGGDTVRNVTACPLAGVCRSEVFDVAGAAEVLARHFLRNPIAQSLARKFKIAVSGCGADCALAAIQDVGVVAVDHGGRAGFQLLVGGGLGTDPRLAEPLEPVTDPRDLVVTVEALLRVWDRENTDRSRRTRVRVRHLVTRLGLPVLREKVVAERERLRCSATYRDAPQALLPERPTQTSPPERPALRSAAEWAGDADASSVASGLSAWLGRCVVEQREPDRHAVYATARLGDVTAPQWRMLAAAARELGVTWRTTIRQNLVARDVAGADLPRLYELLVEAGLGACGERAAASIVSCPGTDTCQRALTASRGVAAATIDALYVAGLADTAVTINASGCTNSCAQQQIADIGLSGQVRRIGSAEAPGYRILLGSAGDAPGTTSVSLGRYVSKALARQVPAVIVALVGRYVAERRDGEAFRSWADRVGVAALGSWLASFDTPPQGEAIDALGTDWGSDTPFTVTLGRGECAS
jgi:sulfite reductase (ferredoxin)